MSKYSVTLKQLREAGACFEGYNKLVANISGEPLVTRDRYATYDTDQPISLIQILDSNGLDDTFWAWRCIKGADREIRLFAVWCARQVQHLMQDERSLNALDVAERFANGLATEEELKAANTAYAAAYAADAAADAANAAAYAVNAAACEASNAADAANAAAYAANAAAYAVNAAACEASNAAAYAAANAAAYAADAANAAANAVDIATYVVSREAQEVKFLEMFSNQA